MKQEHKYAQVLRWIADGETVEWKFDNSEWVPLVNVNVTNHTLGLLLKNEWADGYKFRIKPRTIMIGSLEVEAPVKLGELESKEAWILTTAGCVEPVDKFSELYVREACKTGFVFAKKQDAEKARDAITALLTGKEAA